MLICLFPQTVRESTQFLPMLPAAFYMLGAALLFLRHLKTGTGWPLFWSGLLVGISYGCKFTSLYWAVAFGLYLLLYPAEKREFFRIWKIHVGPAPFWFSAGVLLVLAVETVLLNRFFGVSAGRVEVILGSHLSHMVTPNYLNFFEYHLSFFRQLRLSGKYFETLPVFLLFCTIIPMAASQLWKGCDAGRRFLAFSFLTVYLLHCYVVYKVFPFLHPEKVILRYFLLLAVFGILILVCGTGFLVKYAIDNEVWQEWCEAVMACQTDRSLKSTLTPIVSKLSDMRVVNGELENLVFGPRKEFVTMAILVLINIPLVRFINTDWYHTLVDTIPGQMVIAVCIAAVFVSFAFVVKLTQPIEYRR